MKFLSASLSFSLILLASSPALSQVPSSVGAGVVEKQFEEGYTPKSGEALIVPDVGGGEVPAWSHDIELELSQVVVRGSELYGQNGFQDIIDRYTNETVPLSVVYDIANLITKRYRDAGYPLSFAIVPAQEIDQGRVLIDVIEGFVSEVTFSGSYGEEREPFIADVQRRLQNARPLTLKVLERELLLLNDLPGLTASSVFERGEGATGATRLNIFLEEDHFSGALSLNNRGSEAYGQGRGQFSLQLNSVFGFNEKISVDAIKTLHFRELGLLSLGVEVPIGTKGTTLELSGSYSKSKPDIATLKQLGFESTGVSTGLELKHPFIRSRSENFYGRVKFERNDFESINDVSTVSNDKLYVLSLGADWDKLSGSFLNYASVDLRQGFDIFNATTEDSANPSDSDGSGEFTSLAVSAGSYIDLPGRYSALVKGQGQLAARGLLSSEECGFGGEGIGRAYDNFEISGDHCLLGSLELRADYADKTPFLDQLQGFINFDAGSVWQDGTLLAGENRQESRKNIGIGARFMYKSLSGFMEIEKPLGQNVDLEGDDNPRVFFGLNTKF